MVDYNCMELIFVGDTSCCQNKANPVSHGFPSRIKLHVPYGKSSPSMGSPPPPSQNKSQIAVPILHMEFVLEEICHSEKFCHGISSGGRLAIWYYFPLGKFCQGISSGGRFAICYSFMGNVCNMV